MTTPKMIAQMVARKRRFHLRSWDDLEAVLRLLKLERATGKVVFELDLSQGTCGSVSVEEKMNIDSYVST